MSEKKQPGRFTLQFNLEDPQQRTVSGLLEQQGRHKAQFITSAVMLYTQNQAPQSNAAMTEEAVGHILLSFLEKHSQSNGPSSDSQPMKKADPPQSAPAAQIWDNPQGNEAMMAISETLAAFQSE